MVLASWQANMQNWTFVYFYAAIFAVADYIEETVSQSAVIHQGHFSTNSLQQRF